LPEQSNRLALLVDPWAGRSPPPPALRARAFTFGVESFEAGHVTTLHAAHPASRELFLILSGRGRANYGVHSRTVRPGDCIIFPPHSLHGLDVHAAEPMLGAFDRCLAAAEWPPPRECSRLVTVLELMLPGDGFASYMRSGTAKASLMGDAAVQYNMGASASPSGLRHHKIPYTGPTYDIIHG